MESAIRPWKLFAFLAFFLVGGFVSAANAQQYGGGSESGVADSSIGSDIYDGGSQNNNPWANSGSQGTLSYGTPTQLVFTVSPSDTNHSFPFSRQPVVAVEDASGNIVASDNTDQVTLTILSNPGNGALMGTTTVTVVNGLAQFSGLAINAAGQLYTLQATSGSLTPGTSATFNINPGTGPMASAVWNNSTNAYDIYIWAASDNQKEPFSATDDSGVCSTTGTCKGTCTGSCDATNTCTGGTGTCTGTCAGNAGTCSKVSDTCSAVITNTTGGGVGTPNPIVFASDYTNMWCKSTTSWTPAANSSASGYLATVSISGSTPCGSGTGLNSGQGNGIIPCTSTVPLNLNGGSVTTDSFGNVINWSEIDAIKAKTDTLNWGDISVIKAQTSGLNWYVTNTLDPLVTKAQTFLGNNVPSNINWNDFAVQTNSGINWSDIAKLSVKGINWMDMSVLSNVGINWNDFTVLTHQGINWQDVQKLYSLGVNWNDLVVLGRAGINWDDLGISSKAGINWYDMAIMSGARINWSDEINWYSLADLTHAGVNWEDMTIMSNNTINWYDFRVLSDVGINWYDFTILSKAGINWNDLGVLGKVGINWSDFGVLSKTGINWSDLGVLSETGINWSDFSVLSKTGINWSDFGILSKTGINWSDFGV